ncbi:hypothetical protein C8Q73DRAFT_491809 [Cubamyces lactineus]|nr:hypothetical protein C8Q73DRAFT_491809 [Cubamyces lactineus]
MDTNGTAHGAHGIPFIGGTRGDQRRIMNVNKRKLDAHNGPNSALPTSPSTSRNTAVPPSPRGPRAGLPTPPTSLPPRPVVGVVSPRISGVPNAPRADRERDRQAPPHIRDRPTTSPRLPTKGIDQTPGTPSAPSGVTQVDEGAQRSSKRARNDGRRGGGVAPPAPGPSNNTNASTPGTNGNTHVGDGQKSSESDASKPIPSLLSRLATGASNGKTPVVPSDRDQSHRERGQGRRNNGEAERGRNASEPIVPAKRRVETPKPTTQASTSGPLPLRQSRQSPDPDKDPIGGYSIRGAAKAAKRSSPVDNDSASPGGPTSLLQRLQPIGGAGAGQGPDDGGGRRARKRGRHA